jgi:hypothetical protein
MVQSDGGSPPAGMLGERPGDFFIVLLLKAGKEVGLKPGSEPQKPDQFPVQCDHVACPRPNCERHRLIEREIPLRPFHHAPVRHHSAVAHGAGQYADVDGTFLADHVTKKGSIPSADSGGCTAEKNAGLRT